MKVIFRYKTMKPANGHFQFNLHAGAAVVAFAEHWDQTRGFELFMDALEDTAQPKETRFFFLCNAGDALDFLGDYPDAYYSGKYETKAYVSYVFETTHLSETERQVGKIVPARYNRMRPTFDELSRSERERLSRERRERDYASRPRLTVTANGDGGGEAA